MKFVKFGCNVHTSFEREMVDCSWGLKWFMNWREYVPLRFPLWIQQNPWNDSNWSVKNGCVIWKYIALENSSLISESYFAELVSTSSKFHQISFNPLLACQHYPHFLLTCIYENRYTSNKILLLKPNSCSFSVHKSKVYYSGFHCECEPFILSRIDGSV